MYITPNGMSLQYVHALGSGQFGDAKAVKDRKGRLYCLKEVAVKATHDSAREEALTEVRVMKETCAHPNVVAFHESWFANNRCLCILMEYAPNGSLDKLIASYVAQGKRFTDTKVVHFVEELSGALDYCHNTLRIIHRDIKPANILIDQLGSLKLADFGLSKALGPSNLATTFCGSPLYMSPEQCTTGETYSYPADIWALGCVLYELMAFRSPWTDTGAKSIAVIVNRILYSTPDYTRLSKAGYSERLVDLCRWTLQRTVAKRARAVDLVGHLQMRAPPALDRTLRGGEEELEKTVVVQVDVEVKTDPVDNVFKRAAEVVQRSFRTSAARRAMYLVPDKKPPASGLFEREPSKVPVRVAPALVRAPPVPRVLRNAPKHIVPAPPAVKKDAAVVLQSALRASLNRRRRDTTNLPRALPRRPLPPATNGSGSGTARQHRKPPVPTWR